ncbi:tripartite tricarboxylate transporter TctB family protein [Nisaea sp.]|uniref:tripartite tricarboxylate transporter TctB family protein n=1 Tax=Nisaea sp. TaxID=2024842 RepID=UPI003B52B2D6
MTSENETGRAATAARLPRDFVVGAGVLAFCAIAYFVTLDFKEAPAAVAQNVQPATFPRLVISVLTVLALALMAISFRADSKPARSIPLMVPMTGAMMLGFVLLFQSAGIIIAMAAFCLAMPLLWGERRWHIILPFAVLFPAAIYSLFAIGLDVHFDAGLFGL